jgi:hypothetical protein
LSSAVADAVADLVAIVAAADLEIFLGVFLAVFGAFLSFFAICPRDEFFFCVLFCLRQLLWENFRSIKEHDSGPGEPLVREGPFGNTCIFGGEWANEQEVLTTLIDETFTKNSQE